VSLTLSNSTADILLTPRSIFGRVIPGYVADRCGRFNTLIVTCLATAILVLGLWLPGRGNGPIIAFAALYGFTSGAYVSLAPSLVAQISDIRQIGVRSGSLFAIISVAALTGNPIGGVLVANEDGGFTSLQIFCGAVMALGSVGFIASRAVQVGFRLVKI
jgi:predicted MFS family arabinose efflux permease